MSNETEWVLVPREPTPEMANWFRADEGSATFFTHTTIQCADFGSRYSAMLAASPQPPAEAQANWKEAPPGATHYQPHQDAYYKRVSASEWYVWDRMEPRELLRWMPSPGTSDSAEWVVRPAEAQPVAEVCADQSGSKYMCWNPGLSPLPDAGTKLYAHPPPSAPVGVRYDAGLLSDYGGGNVGWWHDYIRSELDRAHDFYTEALAQQPAAGVGEEIMVNAAHDVYTLPLQPSGLSSGPRFVVHVPQTEGQQPEAVDKAMVFRLAAWMAKQDGHDDPHRLLWQGNPPVPWGEVWMRYEDDALTALTAALAAQQGGSNNDR